MDLGVGPREGAACEREVAGGAAIEPIELADLGKREPAELGAGGEGLEAVPPRAPRADERADVPGAGAGRHGPPPA